MAAVGPAAARIHDVARRLGLDQVSSEQQSGAIQRVAEQLQSEGVTLPRVEVMNQLLTLWATANEERGRGLQQAGGGARYQGAAAHSVVADAATLRGAGARLAAMQSGGVVATRGQVLDYMKATSAADIREKTARYPDMAKAYARVTAEELFASPASAAISARAQTVARKALEEVTTRTAAHFGADGFANVDDEETNAAALNQHAGYVAGELSRKIGVDVGDARAAVLAYYASDGDVSVLKDKLGVDDDLLKSSGWMFSGGLGDDGKWSFWGFGAADKALNRPGVYAGEATLQFAEAMAPGRGSELLRATLDGDATAGFSDEARAAVEAFGLRAAQAGWLTSKLGQGVVEAHNPKKEAKAPSRWAPGNDLITSFDDMAAKKGWAEVVKDLDQIRSYAVGQGLLEEEREAS